jgi:hypothetical protein
MTATLLVVSSVVTLWLFSPVFWNQLGGDARVFYAAARVDMRGGDPYAYAQLAAEESAVDLANGGHPGTSAYSPAPYEYPPLLTRAWEVLEPLGDRGFYWVNSGLLLIFGLLGFELLLVTLAWGNRWLARAFFLVSPAMTLVLVSGNPSTLLLAGWGGSLIAATRNRGLLAGALLAVGWVKPPVGIPVALAMAIAGPGSKRQLGAGFAIGTAVFAAANFLIGGPSLTSRWLSSLIDYSSTLNPEHAAFIGQCCMTSLPSLLVGSVAMPLAVLAGGLLVAAILLIAARRGLLGRSTPDPLLPLALLMAAALLTTPYVHLNDLVLEAIPILMLASFPLTRTSRATLTLWGLGSVTPILIAALAHVANVGLPNRVGAFGLLLAILTFIALAASRGNRLLRDRAVGLPSEVGLE